MSFLEQKWEIAFGFYGIPVIGGGRLCNRNHVKYNAC